MSNNIKETERRMNSVPIMKLLDAEIVSLKKGFCEMKVPKKKNYDGIFETFHGGLLTTAADTAAAAAVLTVAGHNSFITTTDIHIRFLNPCASSVLAAAKVIKAGKTLCPVEVEIKDGNGKTVSIAQITYMVLKKNQSPTESRKRFTL